MRYRIREDSPRQNPKNFPPSLSERGPTKNQRACDVVVQRDTTPLSSTRASSAALLQAEASFRHGDGEIYKAA